MEPQGRTACLPPLHSGSNGVNVSLVPYFLIQPSVRPERSNQPVYTGREATCFSKIYQKSTPRHIRLHKNVTITLLKCTLKSGWDGKLNVLCFCATIILKRHIRPKFYFSCSRSKNYFPFVQNEGVLPIFKSQRDLTHSKWNTIFSYRGNKPRETLRPLYKSLLSKKNEQ